MTQRILLAFAIVVGMSGIEVQAQETSPCSCDPGNWRCLVLCPGPTTPTVGGGGTGTHNYPTVGTIGSQTGTGGWGQHNKKFEEMRIEGMSRDGFGSRDIGGAMQIK